MKNHIFLARLSLSFIWIFTAFTSLFLDRETGREIIALTAISGHYDDGLINAGSLLNLVIGVWLLTGYKLRWACWVQIIVILAYTAVLSIIAPAYWLHPFGPVTKNIPLLVLIYWLSVSSPAPGTSEH
jgi:uncharacterized membrane protein YphA (DoxX/SURF4 family)